ncbi:BT_3987 domain-containing protein [Arsenicibacter rosenii]|uniref:DUF1735 domain-containing protein n=1 Tax=Arsenicibacter rosenii TaxID=1750698 RepID=A0A1S2VHS5_9BACT|nr:DUF1735 domain-containing protein [Arsenicibacter rosenii]OIN57960.1 hypothetical protein BLX24_17885 [Arsenicibacter rosenii]
MRKNILTSICIGLLAGSLSGCLQDKGYTDLINAEGAQPIVSIFGGDGGNKVLGVDFSDKAIATTLFNVNLGSPQKLTQDITVTIGVNPDLLKGTSYELLPTSTYTIPATQLTIKAGTRDVPFVVNLTTSKIDLKKSYALPLTITGANGAIIASNLKDAVFAIKVNNIYAGKYQSTGKFDHPTAGPRDINREKTLTTIDATTSETEFADLGSAATMQLTVNADNTVKLVPGGTASAATVQFGVNTYDPATKTFTLSYKYAGAGGDRVITETIKKK